MIWSRALPHDNTQARVYTVSDWMCLHGFDKALILKCLEALGKHNFRMLPFSISPVAQIGRPAGLPHAERCLQELVIPAFCQSLGMTNASDCLAPIFLNIGEAWKDVPPHTVARQEGHPEIRMHWSGAFGDLVALAHEAAHALQIQLTKPHFVAPVIREACAFLGELALIDFVNARNPVLARNLAAVWGRESLVYFGDDAALLLAALCSPSAGYCYRMNYPLARAAAVCLYQKSDPAQTHSLFAQKPSTSGLLPLEEIAASAQSHRTLALPLIGPEEENPTINVYRQLGAVTCLELESSGDLATQTVGVVYQTMADPVRDERLFIATVPGGRPYGYCFWDRDQAGDIFIAQQQALSGECQHLQDGFREYLAKIEGESALDAMAG